MPKKGDVKLWGADDISTSEENNIEIYEKIAEQFEGLADLFHRLAEREVRSGDAKQRANT